MKLETIPRKLWTGGWAVGELNTGEDSDVNVKDGSLAEQKSTSGLELNKHSGAISGLSVSKFQ